MIKDIIRYIIIILIVIAIILVMKNLISSDSNWENKNKSKDKTEEVYYQASISLVDKNTEEMISGANLIVKDETGEVIDNWTTSNEIHIIAKIKKGTYTLEEEKAPEGYKLNEKSVTFKVENTNVDVAMYNEAMTEEELKADKAQNTSSNEINVDNTLSYKNKPLAVVSILFFIVGVAIISYKSTKRISYFNE